MTACGQNQMHRAFPGAGSVSRPWLRSRVWPALLGWFLLVSLILRCGAQQPEVAQTQEAPTAEQIALWIRQLDDDVFDVRTLATERLIAAGQVAVEPLSEVVDQGSLEVTMRAIYALRQLALSLDVVAQQQSEAALSAIAESSRRPASRMAVEAMEALSELRQKQTIQQLAELGAIINSFGPTFALETASLDVRIDANWKGELRDLQRLRWLRDLSRISFVGPQVTDQWIETIAGNRGLNMVVIQDANITDKSMEVISGLKTVVALDLMYTPVTDRGFELLKRMPSLRQIRCFGTQVTPAAAAKFQAEFANIDVQHKLGAFLGVQCLQPPLPCQVSSVTPDSAAQRAGIHVNDIIVEFDGQPVRVFEDLQKLIGLKKVGDRAQLRVRAARVAGKSAWHVSHWKHWVCSWSRIISVWWSRRSRMARVRRGLDSRSVM